MKYSIESKETGYIETLEFCGKIYKKESIKTEFGCKSLDDDFSEQLENDSVTDDELLADVFDAFDGFNALEFIQMAKLEGM